MEISTTALTSLARVKNRLTLETSVFDTLLERMINTASARIEGECGRTFKRETVTYELHSKEVPSKYLFLLKTPVISISAVQYRAGTPSTPVWTSYTTDEFELIGDGKSGIVQVYGVIPVGSNTTRVTYVGGYLIDWDNTTDTTKHTLPYDITDLCERLVVKMFKRRESEGRKNESFDGGSVSYEKLLDSDDVQIINRHRRLPVF